jgi:hypothetical protein
MTGGLLMSGYRFSLIVPSPPMRHDEILNVTDALGDTGCTDASIRGHANGMELLFQRMADSLQAAIASVISDVERTGLRVARVEMERESIAV